MPCTLLPAVWFQHPANNACLVQELEDKILRLLKEAKGNILDDEVLINNSKLTAAMIQNRVREAEETENNINQVCISCTLPAEHSWRCQPALLCD